MASVLLVDDEPLIVRLLARGVEAMGLRPRFAYNGPEALDAAAHEMPALILTDQHMPGMSGVELTAALAQEGRKTCPVILISGDDDNEIVRRGLMAGVDDFLVKGMPFSVLKERVRFWTQGPFRALPEHIRRAALEAMERLKPLDTPVRLLRCSSEDMIDRAVMVMTDQLLMAGQGFGGAEAERVRFLGVLDQVLAILARTCMIAQLQRVDALVESVRRLKLPWADALMTGEMPRLAELRSADRAFAHAAATLSVSVE